MLFHTHLIFSLLLALITKEIFGFSWLYVFIVVFTSSFPDIDTTKSWLGRRTKPISSIISFFFKHRTVTHSIFPVVIISFILYLLNLNEIAAAFVVGYTSHLILDGLTIQGIKPFYPFNLKIKGFIRTDGLFEKIFLGFLTISLLFVIYNLIITNFT